MVMLLSRGLALAMVVSAIVVVRSVTPAHACSCVGIERQLAEADSSIEAAFVGTVVDAPGGFSGGSSSRLVTWTFRVEEVYAGELPATVKVKSPVSGASCGFEGIAVGSRVGVLLRRDSGDWHAGLCSTGSPQQLAAIGAPSAPSADPPADSSSSRSTWIAALGAAGIAAIVAIGVMGRRRAS